MKYVYNEKLASKRLETYSYYNYIKFNPSMTFSKASTRG